jgi:hypothetical protein
VYCNPYCRAKVHQDPICEGELRCWNLRGPPPHIPNSCIHDATYFIFVLVCDLDFIFHIENRSTFKLALNSKFVCESVKD